MVCTDADQRCRRHTNDEVTQTSSGKFANKFSKGHAIRTGIYQETCSTPDLSGGLNGSTQHFPEVYSQESENLKFVVGVDLSAALLCSDPTGNSRLGLCSWGSIVVRARLCFRSSRVARDSADRRSRLSHPWPP